MTKRVILTTLAAVAFLVAVGSPAARAATFGQIGEAWGEAGTGSGQFHEPSLFGVDPSDGSVYAGDLAAGSPAPRYRIQKFSSAGVFEASGEISRWNNDKPAEGELLTLYGIAVDHEKGLIYLLQGCRVAIGSMICKKSSGTFNAARILVYKSVPEGGKLVPAATPSLPLPGGAEELYKPQTIAVDPGTHDLVILAADAEGHAVVQRVSSTGVALARFVDVENKFTAPPPMSLAVGPDGTAYTLTGKEATPQSTRAWEFPPDLSEVREVPGFAGAVESEAWSTGLTGDGAGLTTGGPQIALSPDGSTLYWKEHDDIGGGSLVRGYLLAGAATKVLYGGGETRCAIRSRSAGLATVGERVIVFDYGSGAPNKVLTFGPGGSGCPTPVAKFTVNRVEEDGVVVGQGETVTFDASPSELSEVERRELIWDFGDGTQQTVKCPPDPSGGCEVQAPPTVTHEYASGGEFTVSLEIKLITPVFGNPPPATHTLKVRNPFELLGLQVRHRLRDRDQLAERDRLRLHLRGGVRIGDGGDADAERRGRLGIRRLERRLHRDRRLPGDDERSAVGHGAL